MMQYRVPAMKAHIEGSIISHSNMLMQMLAEGDRLEQGMEEIPELRKYPPPIRKVICDRAREAVKQGRVKFQVPNGKLLGHMFKLAFEPKMLRVLMTKGWNILEATSGHYFVTCDQPVVIYDVMAKPGDPRARPLLSPGVEITLPLGSRHMLRLDNSQHRGQRIPLTSHETHEMNRRTIIMADRFIYAAMVDDPIRELIRANAPHRAGMFQAIVPLEPGNKYLAPGGRFDVCPAGVYEKT
jgi:hypothetical protein